MHNSVPSPIEIYRIRSQRKGVIWRKDDDPLFICHDRLKKLYKLPHNCTKIWVVFRDALDNEIDNRYEHFIKLAKGQPYKIHVDGMLTILVYHALLAEITKFRAGCYISIEY